MKWLNKICFHAQNLNNDLEKNVARKLFSRSMKISIAESCTGGLLSSRLTDVAGSSAFIKLNFITYSNEAKQEILGVSTETLQKYGAVSEQCAKEMVEGLILKTKSDIAIATTGIAGPDGGTPEKPVGTMYLAIKHKFKTEVKKIEISPEYSRKQIKQLFAQKALESLSEFIENIEIDSKN